MFKLCKWFVHEVFMNLSHHPNPILKLPSGSYNVLIFWENVLNIKRRVVAFYKVRALWMWWSKASLRPKVGSIFISHLHCLTYVSDLSMRCSWTYHIILIPIFKLPHTPLSLVCGMCTQCFFLLPFSYYNFCGFIY